MSGMKDEWDMHSVDYLVMCLDDFMGHMGRHIDRFYGGHGAGQKNLGGRMLLLFCLEKEFCV